jgi:competence protein ComEC
VLALAVALLLAVTSPAAAAPPAVRWTMINVNTGTLQADAHLIRMPDGGYQMIDTGDTEGTLIPYLRDHGVARIERVIISHMHKDHYGALPALVDAGIAVGEVYLNLPDRSVCETEVPWGCDYPDIERVIDYLTKHHVLVRHIEACQDVYAKDGARLRVLYAYDGVHSPVGTTDVNDTSVIMALEYGRTRALLTGDLNLTLGDYLAAHAADLKADILKVPHHGTEGVAPNAFFDAVRASVALVPSPRHLWLSDRSRRVRRYFNEKGTRTFVNGLYGHVTVTIRPTGFTVR